MGEIISPIKLIFCVIVLAHGDRIIADYGGVIVKADKAYAHSCPAVGADFSDAEADNLVGGRKQNKAVFVGYGNGANNIACFWTYLEVDNTDTAAVLFAIEFDTGTLAVAQF